MPQTAQRLPCPQCAAPLRIRDRSLVGRVIPCPECGQDLQIEADGQRGFSVEPLNAGPVAKTTRKKKKQRAATNTKSVEVDEPSPMQRALTPSRLGWGVASLLSVALIAFVFWPTVSEEETKTISENEEPSDSTKTLDAPTPNGIPEPPPNAADDAESLERRLRNLSRVLDEFVADRGRFPSSSLDGVALPPRKRLSWMAELVNSQPEFGNVPVQWDQSWDDPLNDRFVRRQMTWALNPAWKQTTSPDRYPATHFVGVTGVGVDSARLDKAHPRAGIFGENRQTTVDDIRDGLANTMMIAGVRQDFRSWAANGTGTMRGFTQEPYINGPDGFGTGQPNGMHVLMADGSVRFLTAETSPLIVRRMAAMADSLPLDDTVPGEPGVARQLPPDVPPQRPDVVDPPRPPAVAQSADDAEPIVKPPKPVDVAAALRLRVRTFAQLKPVPARELLYLMEEMSGVPVIQPDANDDETKKWLAKPVSLELTNATLKQILDAIVERSALSYSIDGGKILIRLSK